MKRNNKTTGIITLAVVVVLSIVIIFGTRYLSKYNGSSKDASNNVEGAIDIAGYPNSGSILIRSARKLTADDGSVNGYVVTVASKGFGGDIFMDVTFDGTGDTVDSLVINQHKETEGYGAKATEDAFLNQFNGVAAPLSLSSTATNDSNTEGTAVVGGEATEDNATAPTGSVRLVDGVYTAEGEESNGYTGVVTITVEGGIISSVVWDGRDAKGEYKSYLSSVGKYVMVEGNPTWKEQADALSANVIQNQSTKGIVLLDGGKTDSVAGVSITVSEFVNLVEDCLVQSANATTEGNTEETASEANDDAENAASEDETASGTIDGISGATVTSKAVIDGVNKAQDFVKNFALGK